MIIGIGLSKMLADKYGKRNVFAVFLFISTLFVLVFYILSPDSISLIFGAQIFHGFFYGITIPLLWAMIADVADYSEWKNNRRATAIIFSAGHLPTLFAPSALSCLSAKTSRKFASL